MVDDTDSPSQSIHPFRRRRLDQLETTGAGDAPVVCHGQLLLMRKKRELGAGKTIGPGGRLAPGESALQGAVREVQEELGVTPTGVQPCGGLAFQFADGFSMLVYVFTATGCTGEPQETEEATPLWIPLEQIPYDNMWADDRVWFPLMLTGKTFHGRFLFDRKTMLGHELTITTPEIG